MADRPGSLSVPGAEINVHSERLLQSGRNLFLILGVLLREKLANHLPEFVAILLLLALVTD